MQQQQQHTQYKSKRDKIKEQLLNVFQLTPLKTLHTHTLMHFYAHRTVKVLRTQRMHRNIQRLNAIQ